MDENSSLEVKAGDLVEVEIQPTRRFGLKRAKIIDVLSDEADQNLVSLISINEFDIPTEFTSEALSLADQAQPIKISDTREDLRDINLVTVDGRVVGCVVMVVVMMSVIETEVGDSVVVWCVVFGCVVVGAVVVTFSVEHETVRDAFVSEIAKELTIFLVFMFLLICLLPQRYNIPSQKANNVGPTIETIQP